VILFTAYRTGDALHGSAANEDATEAVQSIVPHDKPRVRASKPSPGRLHVWTRRIPMVTIALVMWAATMLALQMAGPDRIAFLAGEGTMIFPDSQ
jgi:hypothetical protein